MFRLSILFIFLINNLFAQDSTAIKRILSFQQELNKDFTSEETSPLIPKDLERFKSLDFFKIDTSFCVTAKFVRTPYETPFVMKTTTGTEPLYVKYGEVHFVLQSKVFILNVYQNQGLTTEPQYDTYLFLPFTDLTNAESSYSGGRFIDLKIPEGDSVLIDFNTSYNPYCAYNPRYSCPIPPEDNHLEIKIPVGVKKFKNESENK
ncbi:DUF1684 domain-containing protein [Aquimarina muelleri]|uniref:DUF1684 domain-containing protein n=1 Tax=Aquimarina muelleri TaxID=279356 RepID=UPI000401AAF4|nr:DUF1684 domain-containing protein [Aquimarina muelleri]MCX2761157.1 DUF1684 domain-containing protein [Aquimarina muelleri]